MKILIADDELPLLRFLEKGLKTEGYECDTLSQLHEILPFVKKHSSTILVLDRMFGDEDSVSIVSALKALPNPPMILMLTALDEVNERVKGLQEGADDYLCKPFDFDELLARIVALKRRVTQQTPDTINSLKFSKLELLLDERVAKLNGEEIGLTKIEYELLQYLLENKNKVLSRERILSRVWQTYSDPNTNIVDVYISRLRKRLDADKAIAIQTLRGNGYRLGETAQA
ncbi:MULTISPECIES: response regulator transcription factor [Alteromonadaceae]|jgi:two-component system response regulator PrrA|uniref:Response regulator transcription factor n=1 Tax=Brumicola blandensis TaxID=3075611 RepID=A0AAW8R8M3_9ALTE|nr:MULTISPECIES: response regulator transcription factor [unclassified Alteromonas]MDT0583543.1 response regulator transcription factor [Alteromonas sp. W409]MDT0629478.1 response regulator transcription factor [Alteromonas sp. W364]